MEKDGRLFGLSANLVTIEPPKPWSRYSVTQIIQLDLKPFWALGRLSNTRVAAELIRLLEDEKEYIRGAAAHALDTLGWKPDKTEAGALYWIATQQFDKCAQVGEHAVDPIRRFLQVFGQGVGDRVRFTALRVLADIDREATLAMFPELVRNCGIRGRSCRMTWHLGLNTTYSHDVKRVFEDECNPCELIFRQQGIRSAQGQPKL